MNKPSGRPKKNAAERKGEFLEVRLSPAEKQTFVAAADIGALPLAAWARDRLRRAAIRELEEIGRDIPLFT